MKKCMSCAQELADEDIFCRYCGRKAGERCEKWYLRSSFFIAALLCVGPLALPLLWLKPRVSMTKKVIISAAVLLASYYLFKGTLEALKSLNGLFEQALH